MGGSKVEPAACPLRGLGPFRLVAMLSVYEVRKWPVLARMSLPAAKTHAARVRGVELGGWEGASDVAFF